MPIRSPSPSTSREHARRPLVLLTLAVVMVHGALLHGAPLVSPLTAGGMQDSRPFSTRTIVLAPEPAATVASTTPSAAQPPATTPIERPAHTNQPREFEPKTTETPVDSAQAATETIASRESISAQPVQLAAASPATMAAETAQFAPPPSPPSSAGSALPSHFRFPSASVLSYVLKGEVKGFPYTLNGELVWQQDGKNYDAKLEYSHFLLGTKTQTSKGELTAQGLAPTRFGDKYRKSEVAAHFERNKGKVSFSANTPDVPLQPGAQDQISVFMQLASMVSGDPDQFPPGTKISFQAIGARYSQQWTFVTGTAEVLDLPGGKVKAIRFVREPTAEFDTRGDVWLAPEMDFLPVRIRLTEANGDFMDQLWKSTDKPAAPLK